jgi:glucose-6-phosphate isomerase
VLLLIILMEQSLIKPRAVLHTALRAKNPNNKVDGVNVVPEVYAVKNKISFYT